MNYFREALATKRSTILYGSFGRYPNLIQFYLDSIRELEPASDYEPIFWYCKKRLLYVLIEPVFQEVIPSQRWNLVITSHLRLSYDPMSTQIVNCHFPLEKQIPFPVKPSADHIVVVPPTSHETSFLKGSSRIDLSAVDNTHEAYLRLLTLCDVLRSFSEWSLSIPEQLRQDLLKNIPKTGPYDSHLLKILEKEHL